MAVVVLPAAAAVPVAGTQYGEPTTNGATLYATVYSDDGSATYHFDYGTSTAYGTSIPIPDKTVATPGGTSVSEVISGLSPGTTYHFRVVATNQSGTTLGPDRTFTTQTPPPPDGDGDGSPDGQDGCPTQAGPGSNNGCPLGQNGPPAAAGTPTVVTGPVTNISPTGWTANATVNAKRRQISVGFQIGLDPDFREFESAETKAFGYDFERRHFCGSFSINGDSMDQQAQPDVPLSCAIARSSRSDPFLRARAAVDGQSKIYYRAYAEWNDGSSDPGQYCPGCNPNSQPAPEGEEDLDAMPIRQPHPGVKYVLGEVRSFEIPYLKPGGICANLDVIPPTRDRDAAADAVAGACGIGGNPARTLNKALFVFGEAAKIAAILKAGGYTTTFIAPKAGAAKIVWSVPVVVGGKRTLVVIASGSKTLRKGGAVDIKIRLNKKGKALLGKKRVRAIATGSFKPTGSKKTAKVNRAFTLKP